MYMNVIIELLHFIPILLNTLRMPNFESECDSNF